MKIVSVSIIVVVLIATGLFWGCDSEKKTEILNTISDCLREEDEKEYTPDIVSKQQRKERRRQNKNWTPENQAKYPIEYCQAQLEKLDKHAAVLDTSIHKLNMSISDCQRKITNASQRIEHLKSFINMAKIKYREAEAKNAFPIDLNGYMLSKQQIQEKIVQATRQIPSLQNQLMSSKNMAGILNRKKAKLIGEQERLVALREKVQNTINDLQTKKVIDGNQDITAVLNSLNDSVDSLGINANDPKLDDIMTPSHASSIQTEFDAIMVE